MQREVWSLSDNEGKGMDDERLAKLERGLEQLKAGLGLLGVTPCSWCGVYYRRSDPATLFHYNEFVCYHCLPEWWSHRCPELSLNDRPKAERELTRWLVGHHQAKVIGKSGELPEPERIVMKFVTGCEHCNALGKNHSGKRCHDCDGRGTVWIVVSTPDLGHPM